MISKGSLYLIKSFVCKLFSVLFSCVFFLIVPAACFLLKVVQADFNSVNKGLYTFVSFCFSVRLQLFNMSELKLKTEFQSIRKEHTPDQHLLTNTVSDWSVVSESLAVDDPAAPMRIITRSWHCLYAHSLSQILAGVWGNVDLLNKPLLILAPQSESSHVAP